MLFVTSFDDTLYKASGKKLIETFLRWQTGEKDQLLCCYEGNKPPTIDGKRVLGYDINDDPYLVDWDSRYRGKCEKRRGYWDRRAWQWYRKVVSLRFAKRYLWPRWMVWVDCDCEFKGRIKKELFGGMGADVEGRFKEPSPGIFHLLGGREWTETGFVVYYCGAPGVNFFIEDLVRCYEDGSFMALKRWDDCWIFDHVRKGGEFEPSLFHDMAPPGSGLRVVEVSPLAKFLDHKKGSHLRMRVR